MDKILGIFTRKAPAGCCGWCDAGLVDRCCIRASDGRIGQYIYGGTGQNDEPVTYAKSVDALQDELVHVQAEVAILRAKRFEADQARSYETSRQALRYQRRHGGDYSAALAAVKAGEF